MDSTSILILIILVIALFLLIGRQINRGSFTAKDTSLTKDDIILGYEKLVKEVIENNKDDKDIMLQKKSQLLKHISKDLHNNIFFDEKEAKEVIQKLASL